MRIVYVVYPDFTGLDLVGPYEVISRWPDADVHFVASSPEPVRTDREVLIGLASSRTSASARRPSQRRHP
jgi:putative intracellular protease/amidase